MQAPESSNKSYLDILMDKVNKQTRDKLLVDYLLGSVIPEDVNTSFANLGTASEAIPPGAGESFSVNTAIRAPRNNAAHIT